MGNKEYILTLIFIFLYFICASQSTIEGIVQNSKGEPIFAANVYLKSKPANGVTTGFDGFFKVGYNNPDDTLITSFIGYKEIKLPVKSIDLSKKLIIKLSIDPQILKDVIISAQDPISENFAVSKIDKMDIYFNPVAQGDPLKALTTLPASTTLDESANPSLRGSSADRSRVVLNGVPVYKPVRSSQLNNQGFFSLFNPEIIDNLYVYASNPPLTFGNSSAGLVEIKTNRKINRNQLQVSTGLASLGVFNTVKLNQKSTSFLQVYGNHQFSDAFIAIQDESFPNIKSFNTSDAGVNFHTKIGSNIEINSFNYFLQENFLGYDEIYTFKGEAGSDNKRFFTVNNINYYSKSGKLSLNNGFDFSDQNFRFGNISSAERNNNLFLSLDYKWFINEKLDTQFGLSIDKRKNTYDDRIPLFYYAVSTLAPVFTVDDMVEKSVNEAFIYGKWNFSKKFVLSTGARGSILNADQEKYLSLQLGLNYKVNKANSFILGAGRYHSYSTPNFYSRSFTLLNSDQIALDYSFSSRKIDLKAAVYYKKESGERNLNSLYSIEQVTASGMEIFVGYNFGNYLKLSIANSFIDQIMSIYDQDYKGYNDLNYFLKTTLHYNKPDLFSLALTYNTRPGTYYTSIVGGDINNELDVYKPVFDDVFHGAQYGNYSRMDLSFSKYLQLKKYAIVFYFSINNLLNTENEKEMMYNASYTLGHYEYYQLRTMYFGLVWQFNYGN